MVKSHKNRSAKQQISGSLESNYIVQVLVNTLRIFIIAKLRRILFIAKKLNMFNVAIFLD